MMDSYPGPYCQQINLTIEDINSRNIKELPDGCLKMGTVMELVKFGSRRYLLVCVWIRLLQQEFNAMCDSTIRNRIQRAFEMHKLLVRRKKNRYFKSLSEFHKSLFLPVWQKREILVERKVKISRAKRKKYYTEMVGQREAFNIKQDIENGEFDIESISVNIFTNAFVVKTFYTKDIGYLNDILIDKLGVRKVTASNHHIRNLAKDIMKQANNLKKNSTIREYRRFMNSDSFIVKFLRGTHLQTYTRRKKICENRNLRKRGVSSTVDGLKTGSISKKAQTFSSLNEHPEDLLVQASDSQGTDPGIEVEVGEKPCCKIKKEINKDTDGQEKMDIEEHDSEANKVVSNEPSRDKIRTNNEDFKHSHDNQVHVGADNDPTIAVKVVEIDRETVSNKNIDTAVEFQPKVKLEIDVDIDGYTQHFYNRCGYDIDHRSRGQIDNFSRSHKSGNDQLMAQTIAKETIAEIQQMQHIYTNTIGNIEKRESPISVFCEGRLITTINDTE